MNDTDYFVMFMAASIVGCSANSDISKTAAIKGISPLQLRESIAESSYQQAIEAMNVFRKKGARVR